MAQLAIKGHPTRGGEVIQLLKMLGGKSDGNMNGYNDDLYYYIAKDGLIYGSSIEYEELACNYTILTIKEFLEKFPYKVDDVVVNHKYGKGDITQMLWIDNEIVYEIHFEDYMAYCKTNELCKYDTFKAGDKVIVKGFEKMGEDEIIYVFKSYDGDIKYKTKNHLDTHYFMEDSLMKIEKSNKGENMEKKINIAELLKDCPKGMELDCTICNNVVTLCSVDKEGYYPINVVTKSGFHHILTCEGYVYDEEDAKCVIYPKGKTTWEGFQRPFKDGDILTYTGNYTTTFICRNKENEPNYSTSFYVGCNDAPTHNFLIYNKYTLIALNGNCDVHLATEEEKQKLFKAIKDNGYVWNAETKTLEKLIEPEPKFKVGDRIKHRLTGEVYIVLFVLSNGYGGGVYDVAVTNEIGKSIDVKEQDNYELVPNKFDISALKPFDNCKYSLDNGRTWKFAQYWYIMDNYKIDDIKIELWQD